MGTLVPADNHYIDQSFIYAAIISIIMDIIAAYMNSNNLHSDNQHGFCKHISCVTQLLHIVEDLIYMLDNVDLYDIIYLN